MREYIAFSQEYISQSKVLDDQFLRDYRRSNRFPIERKNDEIIIMCPSNRNKRWYINPSHVPMYGKIIVEMEVHDLIDGKLFEI
jgi:hypothetical protein